MNAEVAHTFLRLAFVVVATVVGALVSRSLFLAYRSDYGFPKRKGVNGRSRVDMAVLRREIMIVISLILSLVSAIRRTMIEDETPINLASVATTFFLAVLAITYVDLWINARRERLSHDRREGGQDFS